MYIVSAYVLTHVYVCSILFALHTNRISNSHKTIANNDRTSNSLENARLKLEFFELFQNTIFVYKSHLFSIKKNTQKKHRKRRNLNANM